MLALLGSIVLGLGGAWVARSAPLGIVWFGLFFTIIGADALLTSVGPTASPNGESGGIVVGIIFIVVMGIPPIVVGVYSADKGVRDAGPRNRMEVGDPAPRRGADGLRSDD
jgi:hypothetical protein